MRGGDGCPVEELRTFQLGSSDLHILCGQWYTPTMYIISALLKGRSARRFGCAAGSAYQRTSRSTGVGWLGRGGSLYATSHHHRQDIRARHRPSDRLLHPVQNFSAHACGRNRTPSAHSPCHDQHRCSRRGTLEPCNAHNGSWRAPAEGTQSGCRLPPFGGSLYWQQSTSGSSGSKIAARPLMPLFDVIELGQLQLTALVEGCPRHQPTGCRW